MFKSSLAIEVDIFLKRNEALVAEESLKYNEDGNFEVHKKDLLRN